jgi:alpha-tubulin suppressor-like RCC1 family protein
MASSGGRRLSLFASLLFVGTLWHRADAQFDSLSFSPAGTQFACGLTSSGRVYCWGDNQVGQLGVARTGGYRSAPTRVVFSRPIQSISLGVDYACALQDGRALCWGTNEHGELADSTKVGERATPRLVKGDLRFRSLTAGYGVTCGITTSADAFCWGIAESGQLGAGVRSDSIRGASCGSRPSKASR